MEYKEQDTTNIYVDDNEILISSQSSNESGIGDVNINIENDGIHEKDLPTCHVEHNYRYILYFIT